MNPSTQAAICNLPIKDETKLTQKAWRTLLGHEDAE